MPSGSPLSNSSWVAGPVLDLWSMSPQAGLQEHKLLTLPSPGVLRFPARHWYQCAQRGGHSHTQLPYPFSVFTGPKPEGATQVCRPTKSLVLVNFFSIWFRYWKADVSLPGQPGWDCAQSGLHLHLNSILLNSHWVLSSLHICGCKNVNILQFCWGFFSPLHLVLSLFVRSRWHV